jgi:hypothetical protein
MQSVVTALKFYPVSETHGYVVQAVGNAFHVVYVERVPNGYLKCGTSRSRGKTHSYPSVFVADYAIRKEILPLYRKAA